MWGGCGKVDGGDYFHSWEKGYKHGSKTSDQLFYVEVTQKGKAPLSCGHQGRTGRIPKSAKEAFLSAQPLMARPNERSRTPIEKQKKKEWSKNTY